MEVAILGPLRLTVEGQERDVPQGRQRALLALLALHADQVVPADRLIDVIWGDDLPANPSNALQGRVSQLRRLVGREALRQEAAGYRLRLDRDAVDVRRFEQLAERGHDRLVAEDPAGAEQLLAAALLLWRGGALAEFADEPWARPEVARLEERRLVATEDRAEAALALGRRSTVLSELEALLAEHPLRERLRGLVMLAHYRSGRQAAALEVYERGRRLLADELGLDPGPDLQRLQHDILTQAGHLAAEVVEAPPGRRSNLPARLTSFVGREEHIAQLGSLLEESRLVTLTGPGGAGKSRLAMETAELVERPDGAWLVELAAVADADDVVAAVADALRLNGPADLVAGHRDPREQLLAALESRRLLLVLDNCEHVVDAAALLTAQLLARCPGLTVLTTSREPLGISGEVVWSVPSLPVPAPDAPLAEVQRSPAVRLFVDRLTHRQPGFELDETTAPTVAAICRRLDGIPLALELAAARGRALGVADIAAGLDDRFDLLVGGDRSLLPRQRTLRAVIDWSWDLLDDDHRIAAVVLSVFAGRFSLADGTRLLAASAPGLATPAGQLVTGLAERSLLEPQVQQRTRFRMLETIRAYARRQLEDRAPARDPHDAHAEVVADRIDRLDPRDASRWELDLAVIDEMLDDVRAALHHVLGRGDLATAQRLAGPLGWYWWLRGRRDEGIRWLDAALAGGVHDERAALWAGFLQLGRPDAEVLPLLDRACRSSEGLVALLAEVFRGVHVTGRGDPTAPEQLRSTVERARSIGGWPEATAQLLEGTVALAHGRVDAARDAVGRAERGFEEADAWWGRLVAADVRAHLSQLRGEYAEAIEGREHALELARRHGVTESEALQTIQLGNLAALLDEHERARGLHARARRLTERTGERSLVAFAHNASGLGARRRGDLEEAERFHRHAADLYDQLGEPDGAAFAHGSLGFLEEQRGDHRAALDEHHRGLQLARNTGDPRAVAFALEGVAGALAPTEPDRAARLLGAADQLRDRLGVPLPAPERLDVDRIRRRLEARLGPRCAALLEEGASLSADEASQLATASAAGCSQPRSTPDRRR